MMLDDEAPPKPPEVAGAEPPRSKPIPAVAEPSEPLIEPATEVEPLPSRSVSRPIKKRRTFKRRTLGGPLDDRH